MATSTLPVQCKLNQWERHQNVFSIDHDKPAGLPSPNSTRSFWAHSYPGANPLAREGSTGPLTADADVCIIGSGITGVGVAYHLSEAIAANVELQSGSPLKVVILEARDFCTGATGRNGGHLTPAAVSDFDTRVTLYGPEEAKRSYALEAHTASSLVRLIHDHGWTDDVDLVHGGHLDLLLTPQEVEQLQRDRAAATRAGWPLDGVVDMSKDEVEATYGARYPAVKIPAYNLWPLKLVVKLFELTRSRTGAHFSLALHTHTPVTAVERVDTAVGESEGGSGNTIRAYALSTPRGTVSCTRVVHATNGYASHLLPFLAGPRGIVPVRGQIIATRAAVNADEIGKASWSGNDHSEYWFPRPVKIMDERPLIILGGGREAAGPAFEAYVDNDSTCHPVVGETLRAFLPATFEGRFQLGQEPEMEWTGILGYTAIEDPFVGAVDKLLGAQEPNSDAARYMGQFIAAGYSGHGMPRAFGCAEALAQMIAAELTDRGWTQPEWLPTRYLTWVKRDTALCN